MSIELEGDESARDNARWRGGWGAPASSEDDLPPLPDPYLAPAARREPEPPISSDAILGLVFALTGPVGAPAALWMGWAALRAMSTQRPPPRGRPLAIAVLLLGASNLMVGAVALALVLMFRSPSVQAMDEAPPPAVAIEPPPAPAPAPTSTAAGATPPGTVPKDTTVTQHGAVTVVDVGVNAQTLRDELASQRAEAARLRQKIVVMTYAEKCPPCADFVTALADPLMQAAMKDVRLVRVHTRVFRDDLAQLRLQHAPDQKDEPIPGFFLLGVDLGPRDGIHGGEWDDDIPKNIAPVMGAFVQEKYKTRRRPWKPVRSRGIRL